MAPPTTETAHRPTRQAPTLRWWQRPWIIPLALFSLTFLAFSIPPYTTFDPDTARFPIREDIAWHYPLIRLIGGADSVLEGGDSRPGNETALVLCAMVR
ncbi:hypothetical protein [Nocardiopsis oceani]